MQASDALVFLCFLVMMSFIVVEVLKAMSISCLFRFSPISVVVFVVGGDAPACVGVFFLGFVFVFVNLVGFITCPVDEMCWVVECPEDLNKCSSSSLRWRGANSLRSEVETYDDPRFYFIVMVRIKMYVVVFICVFSVYAAFEEIFCAV